MDMVHDKRKSGDPDYDDKVPMGEQVGQTVTGPDGREVHVTETVGPVDVSGVHVNLDRPADDGDNRPAPGDVATELSTVQVYDVTADESRANRTARKPERS